MTKKIQKKIRCISCPEGCMIDVVYNKTGPVIK